MDKPYSRENISKIYCEKCDKIFDSKEKYEQHFVTHSSNTSCESCPIDMILEKIIGFFKGRIK
ncbi:MAG: hypothetical protein ACE5RN_02635 [Nitrosopumilaceae archaeon]